MSATFNWVQTHGTSASPTVTALGVSGNLFNFKKYNDATAANYSTYPITAGDDSYEVWLRGRWTGTFNQIDNLQFWRSTDFSPNTGLSIKWKGNNQTAFNANPTSAESTIATSAIPTSDPGTANVSIGGSLAGNLSASGYSDYMVLQLQTTSAAAAGDTSLAVFTLKMMGHIREILYSKVRKLQGSLKEIICSETRKGTFNDYNRTILSGLWNSLTPMAT